MKRVCRSTGKGTIPRGVILHFKLIERPHFKMRFYPRNPEHKLPFYGPVNIGLDGRELTAFGGTVAWWHE